MDEVGGKEQSESSENGKSLDPVDKEVECPNSSESHSVSAEANADACRGETSQDAAETCIVSSRNNEVEGEGQVEPMEASEASDQQHDTKDTTDPEGDVVTTPVTACSKDADMDEHVASPAEEQSEAHSAHSSHEKPCSIGENDQCEEMVMSKTTAEDSSPSKGKESVSVRILDDQALDSQPSTPPGNGRSEIFDESMLTESPAYSEDGRLVIGTPRSPESPADEAVPTPGFEVDRTRHPADVGCEVEIAGDFLPLDSSPSTTNQCTPSTSQYTPSTNQCTPSTSQYTPSTNQCTPSTSQYTPFTNQCTPSTSQYTLNTSYCENPETETDLSLNLTPSRTGPKPIRSKKRKRKRLVLARKKQRKVMPVRRVVQEEDQLVQAIDQALDLDDDLERKLEENAAKNNLTAINVKSILHHVITNEHVLSMVRNTMTDAGLVEIEREPAAYTPKLTRAKLKEATEKVGNMPYVWPLSPVKNKKATPGFIEINFSDDTSSDDEDYEPTLDELMREESDYESVTSQMSDFGSPCASTPPRSVQPSITESEMEGSPAPESAPTTDTPKTSHKPVARHLQVVPVPMGPPPPPLNPDRLGDDDAFLRELAAVTKEEANIIAHRTRSKLTIDKPLEAIEASFIAPDAEHDMYDVYESDHEDIEWKKWLSSLYRTEDTTHTEPTDDEQNDPEYNFLAEEEPVDKEDFRTDRAVRVSKKELNGLLDEVVEAYGDDVDWLDDFDMGIFDQNPQSSLLGSLMQQKQKFSPSKFYTMPSSFSGKPSTSSGSGASTSSKFRLGEVLSSIMAAALSADATPAAETAATTVVEATTAASATETTATVTEAAVLSASTAMVTKATFPSRSEAVTTEASGQPQPQPPPQQAQQPHQQTQPPAAPAVPPVVQQQVPEVSVRQAPPVAWTIEAKTLPSLTLNGEELQQFQQQLQQHTQLLCQMFLMARENETLTDCANQSKQYLAELDLLAGVNEDGMRSQGNVDQRQSQFQSFFRSCNLGGALELLKMPKLPIIEEEEEFREKKAVTRSKPPPFRTELGDMMAHSKVFIHAELLPKNMFHDISRSSKIIFVEGEDKLVTRGLHQFGKFENGFHLIQSLMMPCKTSSQIRNRIKNLLCHRKCKVDVNNPIVIYKRTKQLVHSPSMCAVVRPHQATAPVNIRNNKKLPKWVLNIQGGQPHIKDCFLESEHERGMRRVQTLSPLKPKLHIPYQIPTQDQTVGNVQDSGPVIGQFHQASPHYILASNVGLTAGGLILQPGQQIIPPGLLPRTVCEVKYVIDGPQMSAIAAGNAPTEGLPSVPQSSTGAESVASPATQSVATSFANPVVNLPPSTTVSLAAQMARAATNVTSSIAPQMELHDALAATETTSHSVVRTLQFSDLHASTAQTALEKINAESYQRNGSERIAMPLPDTQAEIALHTTQEALNQSAERTAQAEAALSVFSSKRRTSLVPLGVGPRNTVRELIMKKRKGKLSPRRRLGGFVSMSSLASKGMSSLNKFKLSTARKSPERLRLRSPNAKQSPGKMTVRRDGNKERSPDSATANQGLAESGESIRTQNSTGERRTSDTDEDCIPLEAALRQLDEEEETMRTASPKVVAVENLIALRCDESLSDMDSSSKVPKEVQSIPVSTVLTASPESGPSPSTKHSPLQMTVRMDDKVATEAHVPGRVASSEPMQGITIGSSVGSASQIITVNRVQSPTVEHSRTASPLVAPPAIPDGDTPSTTPSLPVVLPEDTTSQMSEGAASANGNPKLPFDLATDQSEMMASTATGGKSPTLDEQSAAREFLSGGEQGGPGEDGEEEMETGRRSNVKVAAKRIKSKLRKDLESTVVLLDPDIVNQDPYKEEREMAFAKDFLDRVKEALHDNLDQYRNFLRVFNEYSEDPNSSIANLYYAVKYVLSERPDLIEEFTAFMPPDVALQCGVFLECLEFSKARLFLRQVEVHFYKQPAQIHRIVKTMVQWGETQRNYQDLKEALIPLLKGQPHLEQELSMLFPDSRPPENYMMDFEEINLTDEKKMACDDFEEIELSESEEEEEGTITKQQGRGATYRNILDPWKGLNDELQYGTRSCKCNCHEKSQDSRVQRKTRHCAYCSAMVTRAELISSLRGLCPGRSRPLRDRSVSRRGGGGTGVGKRRGRGSKLADAAKGEETTNEAVNHLSQMCDNLADYLQDNASATEDEDDVEDDVEDDEEGGDEDHDDEEEDDDDEDDHDDDDDVDVGDEDEDEDEMGVATGDDDDDDDVVDHEDDVEGHEDEEEEEEEEEEEDVVNDRDDEDEDDDEGGVISEDDADDEAEDGGELNHMTSGESTDDLIGDHSPCTSQGSRETMDSGNSNSGSQLSTSPASSHTTLLGSGVTMDTDSRSLTCSPMEFQNTLKDEEKAIDAIVDSEKEGVPGSDVVSAEPEVKAKTAPEGMESDSTDGKMKDEQGLDSDASARSGVQETERREQETERREQETPAPAGDKEMMVDGGEQEEPDDGDKVEQGGAAVDPQQSSTGETDGASSGTSWNRDADRVLLQACQEKGAREETFINVASQLTGKTPQQVKERFAILMKLFHHDEEPSNDEDDEEEEEESEAEEDEEEEEEDGGDETQS